MQSRQPQPVVIVKQVKQSHGCLITALIYLAFGWIGLLAMALWKLTTWTARASWATLRAFTVTPLRWSAQGAGWLTRRYGWRGWAVFSVAIVVLAILGNLVGH